MRLHPAAAVPPLVVMAAALPALASATILVLLARWLLRRPTPAQEENRKLFRDQQRLRSEELERTTIAALELRKLNDTPKNRWKIRKAAARRR